MYTTINDRAGAGLNLGDLLRVLGYLPYAGAVEYTASNFIAKIQGV